MKKLNEKSFKLIKICAVLILFLTCGFYYILFADEFSVDSENVIEENVSDNQFVVKKEKIKNIYLPNEQVTDNVFEKEENYEENFVVDDTNESKNGDISKEDDNSQILIKDDLEKNTNSLKAIVDGKVNINIANKEELETLKNIGPKVAENIINYRKENGGFFDIEEIKNVKGIGDKKFDTIKNYIFVE